VRFSFPQGVPKGLPSLSRSANDIADGLDGLKDGFMEDATVCYGCELYFNSCYADVYRMDKENKKSVAQYCMLCCWCIALCPVNADIFTGTKTVLPMTSWG
jgi:ferredoxin